MMVTGLPLPDRPALRKFGLMMGALVALLFGLLIPWAFSRPWPVWPWPLCGAFVAAALAAPRALGPVYRGWMKFGAVAGYVNTRLILGLAFFGMIFPLGVLRRLLGDDPMRRKPTGGSTYRIHSAKHPSKDLERPF
jgi:hypothetical protein